MRTDPGLSQTSQNMAHPLVPEDLLAKSDKILFIAHLALGDFTYLQNCFQAFAAAHPHIKVHLWVDEVRRTRDAAQWEHLKKYSLYDWVESCSFFDKVYTRTYSPALYEESIREARQQAYPIVVSLATLRPHRYAGLARAIAPDGFVAGMRKRAGLFLPHHHLAYRKLDAAIAPSGVSKQAGHISNVYADWFRQLFDLDIPPAARFPFVNIPDQWMAYADKQLAAWNFDKGRGKLVFINPFAKTKKRCWPLERVAELVLAMQKQDAWRDACFIVNAVPQELANAKKVLDAYALERTRLFSAEENFFQLPALLSRCDLIISVETAVMHLANAVHVPVVALMRQKNPEWVPVDRANSTVITASRRQDWVDAISIEQVMKCL
jgi:ADP-heptose:LPS heptosyltransferase